MLDTILKKYKIYIHSASIGGTRCAAVPGPMLTKAPRKVYFFPENTCKTSNLYKLHFFFVAYL